MSHQLPISTTTRTGTTASRMLGYIPGSECVWVHIQGFNNPRLGMGCVTGLSSQHWGQKKAAAKALTDLAEAGGDALPPHAPAFVSALLEVPLIMFAF